MFEALKLLMAAMFPTEDRRSAAERDRMNRFLSQATDRIHLEALEREWFRNHARRV